MMEPTYSPWGEIQHCRVLCPYVYDVDTASHGGIMVEARKAHSVFSEAALGCARRKKHFSGRKCGIHPLTAGKLCAQRPATLPPKKAAL